MEIKSLAERRAATEDARGEVEVDGKRQASERNFWRLRSEDDDPREVGKKFASRRAQISNSITGDAKVSQFSLFIFLLLRHRRCRRVFCVLNARGREALEFA